MEETDLIILWGSNAREAHPIFFHHVLKAVKRGAKLYVVDPRRTSTAEWADGWLSVEVGHDIALANGLANVIIEEGLTNDAFIKRATTGFDTFKQAMAKYDLPRVTKVTSIQPEVIRKLARDFATADRAMICWTLGITEHHNAVDNVLSLINLALLTGHVGKWGSGLNPLRGQNNVQGGGDMGALPHKLAGFQDVENDAVRARFDAKYGRKVPPKKGWTLTEMFHAMERKDLTSLYVIGENPAQSEADGGHAVELLEGLEHLVVQDIFLTKTAQLADVVLPASASFCEAEGTVTNSERRVQRVRKALNAPQGARDDIAIIAELSRRLGYEMGNPTAQELWDECRTLSPMHAGMNYERLEKTNGLQWPCPDEHHPGSPFLHARLWEEDEAKRGMPASFNAAEDEAPVEALDEKFPMRLTTGRRLESYNTGVQTQGYASPLRQGESIDLSPPDVTRLGLCEGERVRVVSRRGTVVAPVRIDPHLKPGLAFMTFHFPDDVDTNLLTIDATDLRSGTAEFKAAAVRVEKLG